MTTDPKPPHASRAAPTARVLEEHETPNGWLFRVAIDRPDAPSTEHEMTLSWVDHDHWTGGVVPPSRLAERLLALLTPKIPDLPPRFDAAKARRWLPDLDDLLHRTG